MALNLQLHELRLRTATGDSVYEFRQGLNIITGSYGTGKSSMFELIKFALGAKSAELMPTIRKRLLVVTLTATFGIHRVEMVRQIGKNQILVTFKDGSDRIENWSATRIKSAKLASERILELLGIPPVRMARRGASGSSVAVSFFDMYRYVYLPQADVPRSVAGHADPFLNPKRKTVLELAYGLSDERISAMEVEIVEHERARDRAIIEEKAVAEFLERAGAPKREELLIGVESATVALRQTEQALAESRAVAVSATDFDDQSGLRDRVARLRALTADFESEQAIAATAVSRNRAMLAQVNLDLQREEKSAHAHGVLMEFEFTSCPRCSQTLKPTSVQNCCVLCGQAEPTADGSPELGTLEAQLKETTELLQEEELRLEAATRQSATYRRELNEVVADLESQFHPSLVFPSVDQVSAAAAEVERTRAQLRELERFQDQWDTQGEYTEAIREQIKIINQIALAVEAARYELERNRSRLTTLGDYFRDEVRALGFGPGIEAAVDENYLPLIDGASFEQLSVAGATKALANDAYYLASLRNALADEAILLPGLLILDAPRTSLGNTPEDRFAGEQLYHRLQLLAVDYPSAQIIVADNGYPELDRSMGPVNVIPLSYESPLLKDVPHPGEGRVQTIGDSDVG